jgi:hypothetical protein
MQNQLNFQAIKSRNKAVIYVNLEKKVKLSKSFSDVSKQIIIKIQSFQEFITSYFIL